MKTFYEKYDDTIQYLNNDKVDGWQPKKETITVEIFGSELSLETIYENGIVATTKMKIVENNDHRLIAECFDEHLGITVFVQSKEGSIEATLTLMNHDYIVGRYLKEIKPDHEKHT